MDIDLREGLSGPETATQILNTHSVPVLFLSSHTNPEVVAQTERISSYGYVVKNSGITVLDASIKMALRLFKANSRLHTEKDRLRQAEERVARGLPKNDFLPNILEHSSQPFAIAYSDGRIGHVNASFERLTGYTAAELDSVNMADSITPTEWHEIVRAKREELQGTRQPVHFEKEYRRKDGSRISVELAVAVSMDAEGQPEYYYGFVTDITERKRAEKELHKTQERLVLALSLAQLAYWEMDIDTKFFTFNDQFYTLYATTADREGGYEMTAEVYAREFVPTEDLHLVYGTTNKLLSGEIAECQFEHRIRRRDGELRHISVRISVVRDDTDRIAAIRGINQDITERKLAEVALHRNERFQKDVLNSLPAHIAVLGEGGKILAVNEPWLQFARANGDPGIEKIGVGRNYLEACRGAAANGDPYAQAAIQGIESVLSGEELHFAFEYPCNAPDCPRWFSMEAHCSVGGVPTTIVSHIDITARKLAEEKIKALLGEKEDLLKEVNHRTKNNMLAIKNLLTMQASTILEVAGRASLLEAANRVQSMMILYDNLLKSSDFQSVPARQFLSSLAGAVVASFSGKVSVAVKNSIEDCMLSVEKSQPLGLILNETLTNVMKHAFVGRSSGKVAVTFYLSEGRGLLAVHDDGLGLPDSIDFKNSPSLGLKLIHLLTKQIGGTVRAERGHGTKVIVEFPT